MIIFTIKMGVGTYVTRQKILPPDSADGFCLPSRKRAHIWARPSKTRWHVAASARANKARPGQKRRLGFVRGQKRRPVLILRLPLRHPRTTPPPTTSDDPLSWRVSVGRSRRGHAPHPDFTSWTPPPPPAKSTRGHHFLEAAASIA
jgi:hypothetical protein